MKRHLVGILVFCLCIILGYSATPIRFTSLGVGSAVVLKYEALCGFSNHSTGFDQYVRFSSCRFDDPNDAVAHFNELRDEGNLINNGETRFLQKLSGNNPEIYCDVEVEGKNVYEVCSTSTKYLYECIRQFRINE